MKSAVCAVAKNESKHIKEWIAFHLAVGFDTILIYDNASEDNTADLIKQSGQIFDVRLVDWQVTDLNYQLLAYSDAIARLSEEVDWIAFIDVDEFFLPVRDKKVDDFLKHFEKETAIGVNELFYGSSKRLDSSTDLTITSYIYRSELHFGPNQHIKSFVRPKASVLTRSPHRFTVDGDYVDVEGNPIVWRVEEGITMSVVGSDIARVNHYFCRSLEDWKIKLARGHNDETVRDPNLFKDYDRNEVFDDAAVRFLEPMTSILHRFETIADR